jgi:hypothetical protein
MKRVSALLAAEVAGWQDVSTRPMFGLRAVYRKGVIFAMLPDKRCFESPNGLAYKEGGKWKVFDVGDERGIGRVLVVLEKAYRLAAKR